MFVVPLALTGGLLALGLLPRVRESEPLAWSFWGAAIGLLAWQGLLAVRALGEGARGLTIAPPRAQHYIQGCCHLCVYAYWGWYWPPVYDYAPLLAGQLVFAYVFDILLAWSRREDYALGLGPFPIIFSTNLFLWFKDDWFSLQFLLVAVGFLGKAFVRWERDGRRVHIFNPSAFTPGAVLAGAAGHRHHRPHVGAGDCHHLRARSAHLPGAVPRRPGGHVLLLDHAGDGRGRRARCSAASALYQAVTGVPYFVDSEIPAAVFLGLHLLVTDPSTSPRTPFGRAIFGVLYGLGVVALYAILGALGMPTFYDKLLCVPLLNLAVPAIDRAVRAMGERPILAWLGLTGPLGRANLAHIGAWVVFFGAMTALGATDGMHRGDALPFWQQACAENRPQACARLLSIEASYCGDNAGWACNELGRHYLEGRLVPADQDRAFAYFSRACEGRYQAGLREPARLGRTAGHQSAAAGPAAAAARRRAEPARDVRAGSVCPRLPSRLGLRVREGLGLPVTRRWLAALLLAAVGGWRGWCTGRSPRASRRRRAAGFRRSARRAHSSWAPVAARDPQAFDNERWSPADGEGTVDVPTFFIARHESHGRRSSRPLRVRASGRSSPQALARIAGPSRDLRDVARSARLLPLAGSHAEAIARHAARP